LFETRFGENTNTTFIELTGEIADYHNTEKLAHLT